MWPTEFTLSERRETHISKFHYFSLQSSIWSASHVSRATISKISQNLDSAASCFENIGEKMWTRRVLAMHINVHGCSLHCASGTYRNPGDKSSHVVFNKLNFLCVLVICKASGPRTKIHLPYISASLSWPIWGHNWGQTWTLADELWLRRNNNSY